MVCRLFLHQAIIWAPDAPNLNNDIQNAVIFCLFLESHWKSSQSGSDLQ